MLIDEVLGVAFLKFGLDLLDPAVVLRRKKTIEAFHDSVRLSLHFAYHGCPKFLHCLEGGTKRGAIQCFLGDLVGNEVGTRVSIVEHESVEDWREGDFFRQVFQQTANLKKIWRLLVYSCFPNFG